MKNCFPKASISGQGGFYNRDGKYEAPNDYMITQVIRADADGVFTYGVPFAGWWGFAALNTAPEKMNRDGAPKDFFRMGEFPCLSSGWKRSVPGRARVPEP